MNISFVLFKKIALEKWPRFILALLALSLSLAALVALNRFSRRIQDSVEQKGKDFLAADFVIQAARAPTASVKQAALELAGSNENLIEQVDTLAGALWNQESFTIRLRAIGGEYPFYGKWISEPQRSISADHEKALIFADYSMKARGAKVGDLVKIGEQTFELAAFIVEEPQMAISTFAPGPLFIIHKDWLDKTKIIGSESRAFYRLLIRNNMDSTKFRELFRKKEPDPHWRLLTPELANRQSAQVTNRLKSFLSLVSLTGLLLGAVGIFMVFRAKLLSDLPQYLILRCLGAKSRDLILMNLYLVCSLGLISSTIGLVLGIGIEELLSNQISQSIKINLTQNLAIGWEAFFGFCVSVFMLIPATVWPLREILKIPVAQVIGQEHQQSAASNRKDNLFNFSLTAVCFLALMLLVLRDAKALGYYIVGLLAFFLLFGGLCWLFIRFIGKTKLQQPLKLTLPLIQWARNQASATILMLSIGSGIFVVTSLQSVGSNMSSQLNFALRSGIPNLILLNISDDEKNKVANYFSNGKNQSVQFTAIAQARILKINGLAVQDGEQQTNQDSDEFAGGLRTREYTINRRPISNQSTVQSINDFEKITEGDSLFGPPTNDPNLIRVSVEESFARRLKVKLGDHIQIQLAGVPLDAEIRSIRQVSWFNFRPNFFLVFAEDDLKDAPFSWIATTHIAPQDMMTYQNEILSQFPRITPIDGVTVGKRLSELINQVTWAVLGVSSFSLLSCLLVFLSVMLASRPQKLANSALLSCLGFKSNTISQSNFLESFVGSFLSTAMGFFLGQAFAYILCLKLLNIPFAAASFPTSVTVCVVVPLLFATTAYVLFARSKKHSAQELFQAAAESGSM